MEILQKLDSIIKQRIASGSKDSSYVASLCAKGLDRCAQKFGEEAVELVISAVSSSQRKEDVVYEAADVIFHFLVLLNKYGIDISDVFLELDRRHQS